MTRRRNSRPLFPLSSDASSRVPPAAVFADPCEDDGAGTTRPDRQIFSNGITGFLFAATGPLAILITIGHSVGLRESEIASWVFGAYGLSGALSLYFCWKYRQPLAMAWTIPGALLLPSALTHLSFPEVIGAYWVTGLLITLLGWTGLVNWVLDRTPMPLVMGMVAGVFLPLAVKAVTAFAADSLLAGVTLLVFLAFAALPALERRFPPVLAALLAGGVTAWSRGAISPHGGGTSLIAFPTLYLPQFSIQALVELVIPLAVTVLAIQNAQGFAILKQADHTPPIRAITLGSGLGTLPLALVGSVPACLTGPVNGILVSGGSHRAQWIGGMVFAGAMMGFGLFSPAATRLALALPLDLIGLIGALAIMRVLQGVFQTAFRGECPLGALIAFVVSVAGVPIFRIGAPFWGLLFAFAASWLLERDSLRRAMGS